MVPYGAHHRGCSGDIATECTMLVVTCYASRRVLVISCLHPRVDGSMQKPQHASVEKNSGWDVSIMPSRLTTERVREGRDIAKAGGCGELKCEQACSLTALKKDSS
jgi:hypothetical protein